MPRKARFFSNSGFLHVIVRGIGKQILFEEDADYLFYLSILKRFSRETGVSVCAYCLMENHVHLLTYCPGEGVPLMMKKLGVSYSSYFNRKYERTGHLFQDRYLSETVDNDYYFRQLVRYILNNPVKAGICKAPDYSWSSYRAFHRTADDVVDTALLLDMLGGGPISDSFMQEGEEAGFLEFEKTKKDDVWALGIIRNSLGLKSGTALQQMDRAARDNAIGVLKGKGLSVRQIERLTGINRGVIQQVKVVKENRPR